MAWISLWIALASLGEAWVSLSQPEPASKQAEPDWASLSQPEPAWTSLWAARTSLKAARSCLIQPREGDVQTERRNSPLCSTGHRPLLGPLPKRGSGETREAVSGFALVQISLYTSYVFMSSSCAMVFGMRWMTGPSNVISASVGWKKSWRLQEKRYTFTIIQTRVFDVPTYVWTWFHNDP